MPSFSKWSLKRLETCDARLQRLFLAVVLERDCVICVGHRGEQEQNEACISGKSKTPWPTSKHNCLPSLAVDVAPYIDGKIPWDDLEAFKEFAAFVKAKAKELGIEIEWGGDWQSWQDWDHWQVGESHAPLG